MTTAEACSRAAVLVLDNLHGIEDRLPYDREPERGQMLVQLRLIETWLRLRAAANQLWGSQP